MLSSVQKTAMTFETPCGLSICFKCYVILFGTVDRVFSGAPELVAKETQRMTKHNDELSKSGEVSNMLTAQVSHCNFAISF